MEDATHRDEEYQEQGTLWKMPHCDEECQEQGTLWKMPHCDEECQEQGTLWKMPHTVMRNAKNRARYGRCNTQ